MQPADHPDERASSPDDVRAPRSTLDASARAGNQITEDLRQSEERFSLLVHGIKDYAIFLLDPQGYVQSWNDGARRMKGYEEDEIVGQHFRRFYPPEDAARQLPERLLRQAEEEGRCEHEGWRVRKDGTRFWADVIITALRDQDERLIGFGKVTRDLTERHRMEAALRQSEERFRLMIETVRDYAIFMLDPNGHVMSWNPGAESLKGYREGEIHGRHFSIFYTPEDIAKDTPGQGLAIAARHGRHEMEGWRVRKDGTRFWADVVISAMRDQSGQLRGFVKVTRDLTERKRAMEERLELAREQAARKSAEEAIRMRDEFLGVAAHELKTPVTSLSLRTQFLARLLDRTSAPDPAALRRALAVIEDQTTKLTALVNKLLDVSRLTHGHLDLDRTDTDITGLVITTVERARLLAPDRLITVEAPGALIAWIDPLRVEQVMTNLLDNAIRHGGGSIEVTVVEPDTTHVQIAVRDHGPGIPKEQRERIFDRFFQGESRDHHAGLGLGLTISQRIVALHGGGLTAEFPPDGGARLIVSLPVGKR